MTTTDVIQSPLKYLDKAMNALRDLGLLPEKPDEAPIINLINQISDLGEEKAVAIARTLNQTSLFNEVVREQIVAMKVGERYEEITNSFNSIRDDADKMVQQLDDGKIDTIERPLALSRKLLIEIMFWDSLRGSRVPALDGCPGPRPDARGTRASALGPALVTDMSTVPAEQKKKLELLIGKYLK